jgi:thioredoxin-like negative regulator of GroEL
VKRVADEATLRREIAGRKAVVLFLADWCPHCRRFQPVFHDVTRGQGEFTPLEVDLDDEDSPLWGAYGIDVVPSVLFFDDGRVTRRLDGQLGVGLEEQQLRAAL